MERSFDGKILFYKEEDMGKGSLMALDMRKFG